MNDPITLTELVSEAYTTARSKGWHEVPLTQAHEIEYDLPVGSDNFGGSEDGFGEPPTKAYHYENRPVPELVAAKLALIHSEVSEALECARASEWAMTIRVDGKPEGFPSELADVVIRIGALCGALHIDLAEAVRAKLTYNKTRSHRHGGKSL